MNFRMFEFIWINLNKSLEKLASAWRCQRAGCSEASGPAMRKNKGGATWPWRRRPESLQLAGGEVSWKGPRATMRGENRFEVMGGEELTRGGGSMVALLGRREWRR
jgi:hypothetical protein